MYISVKFFNIHKVEIGRKNTALSSTTIYLLTALRKFQTQQSPRRVRDAER